MKLLSTFLLGISLIIGCNSSPKKAGENSEEIEFVKTRTDFYELNRPKEKIEGVLVLFGGTGQIIESTKREFPIIDLAIKKEIAVLFIDFDRKIWLEEEYKVYLKESIEDAFETNQLPTENIAIGGFSGGGNITLLISDYLVETNSALAPKGIFTVDSPVDLLELCLNAQRNKQRNFHPLQVQEAEWIINLMHNELGKPEEGIEKYEELSPFTSRTNNIENLKNLDGLKIRFYTEPDTTWWKENRGNQANEMNAHWIEKLCNRLDQELPNAKVELIKTQNMGYRANGDRHPHSWSIVDKEELLEWVLGS